MRYLCVFVGARWGLGLWSQRRLEVGGGGVLCGHGEFLFPLLTLDFKRREEGSNADFWFICRNQLGEGGEGL